MKAECTRLQKQSIIWTMFFLLLVMGTVSFSVHAGENKEIRAIWVTRWDYQTPDDVRAIVRNCKDFNFNVILFQNRGNATAYYKSDIEPWAWELTSDGPETTGKDPGWDPLKLACYEARKRGIELHAYMNVFPAWRTQNYPPPEAGQLWTERPEWFMVDRQGNKMIPRTNWYSFISPGIPEVQKYTVDVFLEVIRRYRIDGMHFDYIRYPGEIDDFSYDPVSLKRFQEKTGKLPQDATPEWIAWRAEQITRVEQEIYRKGKALKPNLIFSAAVVRDPERGFNQYYQDSARWMREGTLDVAMPMAYTSDPEVFKESVQSFASLRRGNWVAPGIGVSSAADGLHQQIQITRDTGTDGAALFAYSHLFRNHQPNERAAQLLAGPYRQPVRPPWK